MTTDPRAALDRLVAALELHLQASAERRSETDPAVVSAYEALADAFELYDEALYGAYGETTPFVLYDEDETEDDDDLADDEDEDDEDDDLADDDDDEDEVEEIDDDLDEDDDEDDEDEEEYDEDDLDDDLLDDQVDVEEATPVTRS